jgi:hypothetical protein
MKQKLNCKKKKVKNPKEIEIKWIKTRLYVKKQIKLQFCVCQRDEKNQPKLKLPANPLWIRGLTIINVSMRRRSQRRRSPHIVKTIILIFCTQK